MKTVLFISLAVILFTGCTIKVPEPKIKYVYKTKIEYIYLPCQKKSSFVKASSPKKKKVQKQAKANIKTNKKYKAPKPTEIYAPKKYTKRPKQSMHYMIGFNQDGSKFLYMEGEFDTDTYTNFKRFMTESGSDIKEVKINSNGGVVSTAMKIGEYIHENNWNTGVDKEMKCFSACTFVYFAGKNKSLQGKALLGLHRPYIPGVPDTTKNVRAIKKDYKSYWLYIHAPISIYDEMMDVDRDQLFILDRNNIYEYIDVKIQ